MQKRLSLALLVLIFACALFPAYYPPDDEALRQYSSLNDIYGQVLFGAVGVLSDFNHGLTSARASFSDTGRTDLLQNIPSALGTRAPPA